MFKSAVSGIPEELVAYALNESDKNDKAHRRDHIIDVVNEGYAICGRFDLHGYKKLIITGCLLHDHKSHVNRNEHHILGAEATMELLAKYPGVYNDSEILVIAQSILEHRASWKSPRISIVSDAVASADRGAPNLYKYIKRSVQFHHNRFIMQGMVDEEEIWHDVIYEVVSHVREKFHPNGYVWKNYPQFAAAMHADKINQLKKDLMDSERITEIIQQLGKSWVK